MATEAPERLRLGEAVYLWHDGQLIDDRGRRVPLRAKSLRMFSALLDRRGTVVSKDHLSDLVWPGRIATDESIARCVADIRKALNDGARRIVQTVPKQGYCLNVVTAPAAPNRTGHPRRVWRTSPAFAAATVAALLAGAVWLTVDRGPAPDDPDNLILPARGLRTAVAVLPFTADADQADSFLAAGLADDLEIRLAEMSGLKTVSQAQAAVVADLSDGPVALSRALDVRYLVSGSVRQSGSDIAVLLRLIDGSDGTMLWAERYEGPRSGLLSFRKDLPEALLGAMSIALDAHDQQRLSIEETADLLAFEDVLEARRALSDFTYEGTLAAERLLRRALERDPGYARAYAELAAAFAIRLENNWAVFSSADAEKAFYFAEQALELDPDLWLAHYALGRLNSVFPGGDIDTALQHLRTAMALQPANDDARMYYAVVKLVSGNPDQALPIIEDVMAAHPSPPFWYYLGLGNTLFQLRRYDDADAALSTCLLQMPGNPYCLRYKIANDARLGRLDDAAWTIDEYAILGYDTSLDDLMQSALERDQVLRAHLSESYRMAGLE